MSTDTDNTPGLDPTPMEGVLALVNSRGEVLKLLPCDPATRAKIDALLRESRRLTRRRRVS